MMTVRSLASFAACLALSAGVAAAQSAPAPPAAPIVTIPMALDWALDAPTTWARTPEVVYGNGFFARTDARVVGSLQSVGQRPTDLPYVVCEHLFPDTGMNSVAGRHEIAERIADYYRTALNPPSKADRPPSWKRSKVSAIKYDATSGQFRFDVTVTYDPPLGDLNVVVGGIFETQRVLLVAGWSDPAFDAAHPGEMSAIRDSLHLIGANSAPVVSPAEAMRTFFQIVVGVIVAAVVALQVVVWRRDRRARDGEHVELI